MKIMYLTKSLGVGGIERNLVRLIEELALRDHESVVVAEPGVLVKDVVEAGAEYVKVTCSPRRPFASLRSALRLRAVILRTEPEVIHVFAASSAAILWLALRLRLRRPRPPVVSTIMGLKMAADETEALTLLRAWGVSLGSDLLLVTAPAIRSTVDRLPIRRRRLLEAQVVGVPPPDEALEAVDLRAELGLARSVRLVVTIGRLAADKSHDLFLEAAAVVRSRQRDVHFLVVGGGPLAAQLHRRHAELALEGTATLLGERHDVDSILRAVDVCVKPGVVEGFVGMTVLEAQALGVPVIAFDTRDVRMAIEDGVTGVIVPAGDVSALAGAVLDLLEDPPRARELGEAGRRRTAERFSMPAIVDQLVEVYEGLRPRS